MTGEVDIIHKIDVCIRCVLLEPCKFLWLGHKIVALSILLRLADRVSIPNVHNVLAVEDRVDDDVDCTLSCEQTTYDV